MGGVHPYLTIKLLIGTLASVAGVECQREHQSQGISY